MTTLAKDIANYSAGLTGPSTHVDVITPSDSAELVNVSRSIFVGGAGNVSVIMVDGSTAVFSSVAAGTTLAIRARQVKATGTTATLLLGLH